jgi:hypothetical protein
MINIRHLLFGLESLGDTPLGLTTSVDNKSIVMQHSTDTVKNHPQR